MHGPEALRPGDAAALAPYASGPTSTRSPTTGPPAFAAPIRQPGWPGSPLKDAVDPGNVFHLNHNVAPSRAGAVR